MSLASSRGRGFEGPVFKCGKAPQLINVLTKPVMFNTSKDFFSCDEPAGADSNAMCSSWAGAAVNQRFEQAGHV
jgi:hypothetical protein